MDPSTSLEDICVDERAYKFFPLRQQQKHNFNKSNGTRVYFHGQVEHDDFEKKKLSEFLEFLKNKNYKYDKNYFNNHLLVLFLSSNQYKNEKTLEDMNNHLIFKSKYIRNEEGNRIIRYQNDAKVKKLMDSGFFYICGRDRNFKPTIVFNLPKADLTDTEAVLRGIVFVQEEVIQKMFIPGQVQSWNIIFDLSGMGLTDLPVNALKSTMQTISANYGGRLYKLWILNAPSTVYFSWKVVKNFLDPITVDKINIIKKNTDDSLWKLFDKSQIQQKYGGTQPNKTSFYPFKLPKAVIDESRLISDGKYQQMIESGFLKNNVIDPKYIKTEKTEQKKESTIKKESEPIKQTIQVKQKEKVQEKKQVLIQEKTQEKAPEIQVKE